MSNSAVSVSKLSIPNTTCKVRQKYKPFTDNLAPCPFCGGKADFVYEKIVSAVIPEMDAGFRPMFRDRFYVIVACANWDCGCRTKTGAFCQFDVEDGTGYWLAVVKATAMWDRRSGSCGDEIADIEMKL